MNYWEISNEVRSFIRTMNNKLKGIPNFYVGNIGEHCGTYVNEDFCITLDLIDVENYVAANGISTKGAIKLLLSHEIFHILLGHFSSKYKDYNKRLLNIAGDLEINSYLGIEHPGITADVYGWSPLLSTEVYYQKLLELIKEKEDEEDEYEEEFASQLSSYNKEDNDYDADEENFDEEENEDVEETEDTNSDSDSNKESNYDESDSDEPTNTEYENMGRGLGDELDVDIPEDVIINTRTSDMLGDKTIEINCSIDEIFDAKKVLKEVTKKVLSEYKNYSLDGLDKIMSKLVRTENVKAITPHTRKSTYYKLNNRRQNGDFILPGKRLEGGNTKKKFDKGLTVFIDVSGSTKGAISNNLKKVAFKLYEQGANIVYYNGGIVNIVKSTEPFKESNVGGGTNIVSVVDAYIKNYGKLERVYVFTDGQDNFTKMGEVCDKYKIFYIGHNYDNTYTGRLSCWEQYSDKNPQKSSRWSW